MIEPVPDQADQGVFVVAATKSWNRRVFDERLRTLPGRWLLVDDREGLTLDFLQAAAPDVVFFLHWSWLVPKEILDLYECIGFHLGDVPYGRGGSPLQNLVARGHHETYLTAFRLTKEFDAGPVYAKRRVSLEGGAEEIYIRASEIAASVVAELVQEPKEPVPQEGEAVVFERRTPADSEIPQLSDLRKMHDFIRMLDAEGYPLAYLNHQGFRFEFYRSTLYEGRIEASVRIQPLTADSAHPNGT
jgi:methionyl-tRNA formyltransferase